MQIWAAVLLHYLLLTLRWNFSNSVHIHLVYVFSHQNCSIKEQILITFSIWKPNEKPRKFSLTVCVPSIDQDHISLQSINGHSWKQTETVQKYNSYSLQVFDNTWISVPREAGKSFFIPSKRNQMSHQMSRFFVFVEL